METIAEPADSGPLTCAVCKCSSAWRAAFTEVRDGTRKRLCCPACAQRFSTKMARLFTLLTPVALAMAIWMYLRRPHDLVPVLLVAFWLYAFSQSVLVLLHELGHAAAAWLLRAPAFAIVIGGEPWLLDRTIGGVRWRVGYRIRGGLTYHAPSKSANPRRDAILITAAGPLVNLIIAVAALGFCFSTPGRLTGSLGKLMLFLLGTASISQLISNVWPRTIKSVVGRIASDGARILALWRGEADDPRLARMGHHWNLAAFAFLDRDFISAERETRRALDECDGPQFAAAIGVLRGAALSESDRVDEAVAVLRALHERPIDDPGIRAAADDNLAWAYFLVDEPGTLERSLGLVERACALTPWEDSFTITRACLLAASASAGNGREEQARALLASLRSPNSHRQNRAYAALARGLIACATGEFDTARREYANAKSRGATAAPLRVLERRIVSP